MEASQIVDGYKNISVEQRIAAFNYSAQCGPSLKTDSINCFRCSGFHTPINDQYRSINNRYFHFT